LGPRSRSDSHEQLSKVGVVALGLYLVSISILLVYLIFGFWPTYELDGSIATRDSTITLLGSAVRFTASIEVRLILLVLVSAALGSYVHAATSFADFVGNRRLSSSWVWWYVLRMFIGASLALIFYFALRGGLLTAGAGASNISPFGVTAVAAMVGLFSKQATDKLSEVFDTLFRSNKPEERMDKLVNPAPQIDRIQPQRVQAGVTEVTQLTISGKNFLAESIVVLGGVPQATTFVSTTQLSALISTLQLASPGEAIVMVFNPPPGGGASNVERLVIERAS
jgi:hypothetical protein